MQVRKVAMLLALTVSLLGAAPALAATVWVGENLDIHQNKTSPVNDFHIQGTIQSASGGVPTLQYHIDDVFTSFSSTITALGGGFYSFTADWSRTNHIPYCTVVHLGLFFQVNDYNVMINKTGWWTHDGAPAGNWPMVGFEVPDNSRFRLQGGNVNLNVSQLQFLRLPWTANPQSMFDALTVGASDSLGTWVAGTAPGTLTAGSFFDVDFDTLVGQTQPGDFLLARVFAQWPEETGGRWFFEAHQASPVPLPATLLLFGAGLGLLGLGAWRRP